MDSEKEFIGIPENSITETPQRRWTFTIDNSNFNHEDLIKEDIENVEGAFIVRNLLTRDECDQIITSMQEDDGEKTVEPVLFRAWSENPEEEYKKLGVRIIRKSKDLSSAFWERIKHFVPETLHVEHGNEKETWKSEGLDERVRFVRYESGQSFPPHMDGPYRISNTFQSHLTALIYLDKSGSGKTSDFKGGELVFLEKKEKKNKEVLKKLYTVVPEPGLLVVFPHKTFHEGKTLKSGQKYVIRDDVFYTLTETVKLDQDKKEESSGENYQLENEIH